MAAVAELHNQSDSNAKKWSQMLSAPQDHLVRAPSNTPFLASKTRFVKSYDITYAQTNAGAFTVAAMPNAINALAITGAPTAIPAASSAMSLTTAGLAPLSTEGDASQITHGLMIINDDSGKVLGTTNVQDLSALSINYSGYSGVRVVAPATSVYSVSVTGLSAMVSKYHLRLGILRQVGAVFDITWPVVNSMSTSSTTFNVTVPAATTHHGFILQFVTTAGIPITLSHNVILYVTYMATLAQVPTNNGSQSFDLVNSAVIEAGSVTLQRCTAISMLVTDMTPQLDAGGELVMCRGNFDLLTTEGGTSGLMSKIKSLPEERYWRSGNMREGGYAWWLPDDLQSYEPLPVGDTPPTENVLIAAGIMPSNTGQVRVIITWNFEFYTPVQLFSRDYNLTYSQCHRDMFIMLSRAKACSANAGHLALLGSVVALASSVYDFYDKNRAAIDGFVSAGRKVGAQLVSKKTRDSVNKANQQKNKARNQAAIAAGKAPPIPARSKASGKSKAKA